MKCINHVFTLQQDDAFLCTFIGLFVNIEEEVLLLIELPLFLLSRYSKLVDTPWRSISPRNIGFIGHVARYALSSAYVSERNTAPSYIN